MLVEEARIYDQNVDDFTFQVLELEHRGDGRISEILSRLNRLHHTSGNRECSPLAARLDDALDGIEDVADALQKYCRKELLTKKGNGNHVYDRS